MPVGRTDGHHGTEWGWQIDADEHSGRLQDIPSERHRQHQRQGAQSAPLPQAVVLHHAGRPADAVPDRQGSDDGVGQPEAGR